MNECGSVCRPAIGEEQAMDPEDIDNEEEDPLIHDLVGSLLQDAPPQQGLDTEGSSDKIHRLKRENLESFESHLQSPIPGVDDGGKWQYRFDKRTISFQGLSTDETTSYVEFLVNLIFLRTKFNLPHSAIGKFLELLSQFPKIPVLVRDTLPTTYRGLMTFIEELGKKMSLELVYDTCSMCYFIFRGQHKNDTHCPCKQKRYDSKGKPFRQIVYRTLRHWLERLFSCVPIAKEMDYHSRGGSDGPNGHKVSSGEIVDIYDGRAWKSCGDAAFESEPRHVRIGIATDGVQPFRDNDQYSIWPIVVTTYNLPPTMRYLIGPLSLVSILPGKHSKNVKMDIQPVLNLLTDELVFLDKVGWFVNDASRKDSFVCRIRLVHLISDLRGLEKVLDQPPVPAKHACLKCWVTGHRIPGGKTIYPGIVRELNNGSLMKDKLLSRAVVPGKYVSPHAGPFPRKTKSDLEGRLNQMPSLLQEKEDAMLLDTPPQSLNPARAHIKRAQIDVDVSLERTRLMRNTVLEDAPPDVAPVAAQLGDIRVSQPARVVHEAEENVYVDEDEDDSSDIESDNLDEGMIAFFMDCYTLFSLTTKCSICSASGCGYFSCRSGWCCCSCLSLFAFEIGLLGSRNSCNA